MVIKMTGYGTRDGKIFCSEDQASEHEKSLDHKALHDELIDLVSGHNDRDGADADAIVEGLLKLYDVKKKEH